VTSENTPPSITTANRWRSTTTPTAVTARIENRTKSSHGLICSPRPKTASAHRRWRSATRGLRPATQAALAVAWVAVGPVKNRNSPMMRSLTVISVKPDWMARPMMSSSAPKVSVTPPACSRV
jgi:hypothetical protein